MGHQVFNIQEVADYLHIASADVKLLVRSSEIPFERMGPRCMFRKQEIDAWASQRILGLHDGELTNYHRETTRKAQRFDEEESVVRTMVQPEFVVADLTSKTKAGVIRDMVTLAERTDYVVYPEDLLASLQERERMGSTALAGGLALLHPKHHDPYTVDRSFVCLGRTVQAVPFGSPDGRTTDLFFLICCQDEKLHLHALTRICMMCYHTSVLFDLREAKTADEMFDCLCKAESEVQQCV